MYVNDLKKSIKNVIKYEYIKERKSLLHIGYGIDNNFVRCTGTSIYSFVKNNINEKIAFHIVAHDLSNDSKEKFKILAKDNNINIYIYEIDSSFFKDFPTQFSWPTATYFRFLLPIILNNIERLLYIDADVICLGKIREIFNINLENHIIGAISESEIANKERNKILGLNNHIYFNAGVLLIDIKKWNEFNVLDKAIEILNKYRNILTCLDQDMLNMVLTNHIKYLDKKFNWLNWWNYKDVENININNIVLMHFTAHPKPWDLAWNVSPICTSFNKDIYKNFEDMTPWKNMPLIPPKNYKEMEHYAKDLKKRGYYLESLKWYKNYLINKIIFFKEKNNGKKRDFNNRSSR